MNTVFCTTHANLGSYDRLLVIPLLKKISTLHMTSVLYTVPKIHNDVILQPPHHRLHSGHPISSHPISPHASHSLLNQALIFPIPTLLPLFALPLATLAFLTCSISATIPLTAFGP
jgi:hypothetical protein